MLEGFIGLDKSKIAILGLGYVGLPLAVEFGKKNRTVGFDISKRRVHELQSGIDNTLEITKDDLVDCLRSGLLTITDDDLQISDCNIFIVTVPTPTDKNNRPVLSPLIKASITIGKYLKKGDIVIYESTVYPGVTEDECGPVLEETSGLKCNIDFFLGYSPERINPGDKEHTVTRILKITSGSTPEAAEIVDELYSSIITAGTHKASSIRVAEAAKVIENSQRDINIAFVNELSKIFSLLDIDTKEVLEAASTKWNFLRFSPGLVGGHCIGVDPYYLAQKAQEVGYHPEIILAGRRTNDSMGKYVALETIKHMMRKGLQVLESRVLILGFTFKEDCPDVRNTKVIDIYTELSSFGINVDVYDPWANPIEVENEYNVRIKTGETPPEFGEYSALILAVAHNLFKTLNIRKSQNQVVFDVKSVLSKELVDARL